MNPLAMMTVVIKVCIGGPRGTEERQLIREIRKAS